MTTRVTFAAKNGEASGDLAEPAGAGKAPAIVLVQEWWGVNDHIRSLAKRLADEGFLTLAVDLFHGKVTKDPNEAGALMQGLDKRRAIEDIRGAVQFAKAHARSNGHVGVVGFCMGGAMTFAAACNIPEVDAAVPFYGVPDASLADYDKVRAPIMAHFAKRDGWAKPEAAKAIQDKLAGRGQHMELHTYDADHAFMNDTRPEVFAPEAAKLAWSRTVSFFHAHLG